MKAGVKIVNGEEIAVYVNENSNIVQSNYMISHKEHWTMAEERLFVTALAMVNVEDKALNLYKIPISTFVDLWGVDKDRVFSEVIGVLESLSKKGIYSKTNDYDRMPALSRAIYNRGSNECLVQIHPDLQKHIIQIRENGGFTSYKLENALNLNRAKAGVNAHRLHELCRSYARQGKTVEKAVTVEELRKALDLGDKYKQLRDFERKVLTPCVQKINENTDLQVFYEMSGRGKKAVVTFTLSIVQREKLPEPEIDPAPVPVPELPDLPEVDPLPDFDPYSEELPEGDAFPNPREECLEFVREELKKLPNYQFTEEEVELLLEYCFQNGCMNSVEVSDYARVNVLDARQRWVRVKYKNAYIRKTFKENHGGWARFL